MSNNPCFLHFSTGVLFSKETLEPTEKGLIYLSEATIDSPGHPPASSGFGLSHYYCSVTAYLHVIKYQLHTQAVSRSDTCFAHYSDDRINTDNSVRTEQTKVQYSVLSGLRGCGLKPDYFEMKNSVKLERDGAGFILKGQEMPRHIQVAFGRCRYLFRLCHRGAHGVGLWLRDLPLNMHDLKSQYGFGGALEAYRAECDRTGVIDYSVM